VLYVNMAVPERGPGCSIPVARSHSAGGEGGFAFGGIGGTAGAGADGSGGALCELHWLNVYAHG
jgi:hypothetical protein